MTFETSILIRDTPDALFALTQTTGGGWSGTRSSAPPSWWAGRWGRDAAPAARGR
ncbi:MAG TPA: hypothetical protein VF006_06995 [Longimicrobium sp.]